MSARPLLLDGPATPDPHLPVSDFEALKSLLDGELQTVVDKLTQDRPALARLVEEHRIFKEAIEKSPVAYCDYDADDRLIAFNAAYARLHPALTAVSRDTKGKQPAF